MIRYLTGLIHKGRVEFRTEWGSVFLEVSVRAGPFLTPVLRGSRAYHGAAFSAVFCWVYLLPKIVS